VLLGLLFALAVVPLWHHWWFWAVVTGINLMLLRRLAGPLAVIVPHRFARLRRLLHALQSA
jgi:hypothetical protein